ncbi:MAG TPA: tRNA pseudouridine(55) synthase TruB [Casimicrobiaceae bacterium]|nr:tRNA pseudouridine(55) synthase TruB [Casimicrobiaceae bacterium]
MKTASTRHRDQAGAVAIRPSASIQRRRVDGVLLLDKPVGLTSNAALQRVKRLYRAEKAGHTGTLDPLASGLLPICLGEATKFAHMLLDADKSYVATIRLGVTTSTADAEGEVLRARPIEVSRDDVEAVLPRFVGTIAQRPPRHAALKYRGRNYYEYARAGVEIPRAERNVVVSELALEHWSPPDFVIWVRCGKGTYVRVLAEDIGEALGCGAHLAALRRAATGGFDLRAAATLETLATLSEAERDLRLLATDALVAALPRIDLTADEAARLRQGQAVARAGVPEGIYRVYATDVFAGVAHSHHGKLQPRRLVAAPARPSIESLES